MTATMTEQSIEHVEIIKEVEIAAPIELAFQAMLEEIGPELRMEDGTPMPMKLEAWPGGRWYRDLGNNAGHLWGHVQVIKPPKLLEICGPLPMSYPVVNHLQYRFTPEGNGTRLKLTHKGFGLIPPEHRDGMPRGWEHFLSRIRENAEKRTRKH